MITFVRQVMAANVKKENRKKETKSIGCRRLTRATMSMSSIAWYTKLDAECDQQAPSSVDC